MATNSINHTKLILFAVNTSELYDTHLQLADNHATILDWFAHTRKIVAPLYLHDVNKDATFTDPTLWETAKYLHDYYNTIVGQKQDSR